MVTFFSILAVGFFLGMRHATDPDHVIAVTAIVSNQRTSMRAALIGAFWGVGHTLTILVVGAGIILFNLVIPVRLGLSMELSVAVMLMVLGGINVVAFLRSVPGADNLDDACDAHNGGARLAHTYVHRHGNLMHNHAHTHATEACSDASGPTALAWLDHFLGQASLYQYVRPLMVGIVHGLAGSAAVALLVLTTIRDPRWALGYLLVFGVGTIAGMMLITMGIASTFKVMAGTRQKIARNLAMASGLLSMAFGVFVAYQICVVSGLLTGHARWTPQ